MCLLKIFSTLSQLSVSIVPVWGKHGLYVTLFNIFARLFLAQKSRTVQAGIRVSANTFAPQLKALACFCCCFYELHSWPWTHQEGTLLLSYVPGPIFIPDKTACSQWETHPCFSLSPPSVPGEVFHPVKTSSISRASIPTVSTLGRLTHSG